VGAVVEPHGKVPSRRETVIMVSRLLILSCVAAVFPVIAAEKDAADLFSVAVSPVEAGGHLYVVGREGTFFRWGDVGEAMFFYEYRDAFLPQGVFNGDFRAACARGESVYVLDGGGGIAMYAVGEEGGVKYTGYVSLPGGIRALDIGAGEEAVDILAYVPAAGELAVFRLKHGKCTPHPVFRPYVPEGKVHDARYVPGAEAAMVCWREPGARGVRCILWKQGGWIRRDFTGAFCNTYEMVPAWELFYIERQRENRENRIAACRLEEDGWGEPRVLPLPSPRYGVKYGRIRAFRRAGGELVLTRTHYLPFSVYGVDVFARSGNGWRTLHRTASFLWLATLGGGMFVLCVFGAAAVCRRACPFVLYRNFNTIQVGTLLARGVGYFIDSVVALLCAFVCIGALKYQDMKAEQYVYVLYVIHWVALGVYGVVAEFSTGRTLGKAVLGLEVRNAVGMHCSFREVLVRNIFKVLEATALFVPLFFMLFTDANLRLGDVVAGTRVQRKRAYGIV